MFEILKPLFFGVAKSGNAMCFRIVVFFAWGKSDSVTP